MERQDIWTRLAPELRATDGENGTKKIEGYAAVFNSDSVDMGLYTESLAPGAFSRTLRENPDVRALFDHDTGRVIGRIKSGTLKLREDERGLFSEITTPDTSTGRDLIVSLGRGDIDAMSFGFIPRNEKWEIKNSRDHRILLDVDLYEVSVVAFPAYEATTAVLRSARSTEEIFRNAPRSYSQRRSVKRHIALLGKEL